MESPKPPGEITQLLTDWSAGSPDALNRLMEAVYAELHRLAAVEMRRELGNRTIQPTALVHELYLRLQRQQGGHWESRGQFFCIAAKMMRRLLVDQARSRAAAKRGGNAEPVDLADVPALAVPDPELLDLNEALNQLEKMDPRKTQVVELKYFAGLNTEEIAEQLGISRATVERDWAAARAWLQAEMGSGRPL